MQGCRYQVWECFTWLQKEEKRTNISCTMRLKMEFSDRTRGKTLRTCHYHEITTLETCHYNQITTLARHPYEITMQGKYPHEITLKIYPFWTSYINGQWGDIYKQLFKGQQGHVYKQLPFDQWGHMYKKLSCDQWSDV